MITVRQRERRFDALLSLALRCEQPDLLPSALGLIARVLPGADVAYIAADPDTDAGPDDIPVTDEAGRPVGYLRIASELWEDDRSFVRRVADVISAGSAASQRAQELRLSERRLIDAQRISKVGSYDFEIASNTNIWSDQLYRIYGRVPQSFEASYEVFLSMLHPDDVPHVIAIHQSSMANLEPFEMEERVIWPDGQVRTLASWGEVVVDADGQPARMGGICWDITERRAIEDQLVHDALHDRLSGLPNRTLFVDRLTQAIAGLARRTGLLAVLFLDIDRFKVINDGLGHEAGDEVLLELSRRLAELMRPGDTVARFGGDEFVVLCDGISSPAQAGQIARRLQEAISAPVQIGDSEVVVTMSAGIAVATSEDESAADLLRDADAAMYRAKRDGGAHALLFDDRMRDEAQARLGTEVELRKALATGELRLHYQPVVDLDTGVMTGVEALLRWDHPTRGLVMPSDIIPIAEETGLIVPIGEWALEQACEQLLRWQRAYPRRIPLTLAVNLSGVQLAHSSFVDRAGEILSATGIDPATLTLEMTETVLMRDAVQALEVLEALKALGVSLSIDDFGTGYSSLSYLKRFPVDVLKIDRSFVDGVGSDPEDQAIVQAIVALAGSMGMGTVAEGLETTVQQQALRDLGCRSAQGYLLGRPVPAEAISALLRAFVPMQAEARTAVSQS
ncbi:MAG: diguanylate cyclase/phosphodiesterase with and sensor(s) [Frankiales bacterium]|nr:diguanylate cyclase/phosphodiesterase with and sensor(s) [Frankiales bacterium]